MDVGLRLIKRGLGYDWSDVGVITNITAAHLGQDGLDTIDDLAHVKALVAERVRDGGTLVLNADDERLAPVDADARALVTWWHARRQSEPV